MEYFQLTLKIPIPSRHWFRFRVRTLLLMMLIAALIFSRWRVFHDSEHARLMTHLVKFKAARDTAIEDWKRIHAAWLQNPAANSSDEVKARTRYFEDRAAVEAAVQRLARYEERNGKTK